MPPESGVAENQPASWQEMIPADATIEQNGKPVFYRDLPIVKETKDLTGLVKQVIDSQSELGRRVRIPDGKTAKPEDVAAFREKLAANGLYEAPPASPDKYEIKRPEAIEGTPAWSENVEKEFKTLAHSLGLTQKQAQPLVDLYNKVVMEGSKIVKTSMDEAMAGLKKEWGADADKNMELSRRAIHAILKDDPEIMKMLELTGLGNLPALNKMMAQIGGFIQEDGKVMGASGQASSVSDEAKLKEANAIMFDPKHPENAAFRSGDKTVKAKVDAIYREVYGDAPANAPRGQSIKIDVPAGRA